MVAATGVLFGLPGLRIEGFYLVASTLAAQFFFQWLFTNYNWFSNYSQSLTISTPRLQFLGMDLGSATGRFLLVATVAAAMVWLDFAIVRSRTGRD